MFKKFKGIIRDEALVMSITIILVAAASFGLGRASVGEVYSPQPTSKVQLIESAPLAPTNATSSSSDATGTVVASKNSTKYHFLHCPGAKQIAEQNKITFTNAPAAEAAGFTLAGNCK